MNLRATNTQQFAARGQDYQQDLISQVDDNFESMNPNEPDDIMQVNEDQSLLIAESNFNLIDSQHEDYRSDYFSD